MEESQTDEQRDAQMIAQPQVHDEMSHGLHLCDIIYPSELRFHIANRFVDPLLNAARHLPVAQQGAMLPQVAGPSPNGAKQSLVVGPFPNDAEHLLDARPSSAAPYPRDALRLAARQPNAPKQHASEAPPFAAPQLDAYCCYRCSSCVHYTTRQAAPPLANAKKLHVVEKMPLNSKLW